MNNDNLNKWSAIAQVVSSLAIVITLVYLAVQTRQNTDAIHATSRQNVVAAEVELINTSIEYPEVNMITQGLSDGRIEYPGFSATMQLVYSGGDLGGFSPKDVGRTFAHLTKLLRVREGSWMQYNNGVLDDETWQVYRDTLARWLRDNVLLRDYWGMVSSSGEFHPGFVEEMNAAVNRIKAEQSP